MGGASSRLPAASRLRAFQNPLRGGDDAECAAAPPPSPAPSPTPQPGGQQAWGAWASFGRAETANGPPRNLTSPRGEFGGKQNPAGASISGQEGAAPCPETLVRIPAPATAPAGLPCLPKKPWESASYAGHQLMGEGGYFRERACATKVCSLSANSCYFGTSGLVEDSVKSLTGAQHPVGAQFMLNPLPKP